MKLKIAYFASVIAMSLLTLATGAFADADEGFYEKDHIRGFISIGADYRGMRGAFQRYVNSTAFANLGYVSEVIETTEATEEGGEAKSDTVLRNFEVDGKDLKYSRFNAYYLGLHVNIGAQYKQFMTWFDINFMPTQVSDRPSKKVTVKGNGIDFPIKHPLYDVEWFAYGIDWMFGWKLFGEDAVINLIPAVGFGFNLINFHLASNFDIYEKGKIEEYETLRDRSYSTMATTVNAELEFRVELGRFALGAYGGYRFIRYNELEAEGFALKRSEYDTDNVGDTWYAGARATWYFLSGWEKKQQNKL